MNSPVETVTPITDQLFQVTQKELQQSPLLCSIEVLSPYNSDPPCKGTNIQSKSISSKHKTVQMNDLKPNTPQQFVQLTQVRVISSLLPLFTPRTVCSQSQARRGKGRNPQSSSGKVHPHQTYIPGSLLNEQRLVFTMLTPRKHHCDGRG